jgi:hypothetical protein
VAAGHPLQYSGKNSFLWKGKTGHSPEYSGKISFYRRKKQVVFVNHSDDGR